MTEVDAAVLRRKLSLIIENLRDLATVEQLELDVYPEDRFRRKATERLLQETIEAAVDINLHLLRAEGAPVAPDYFTSFVEVGRRGILSPELAERLAPSAGLRNRLVHEYESLDDRRVLAPAGDAVRDFSAYVAAVEAWLGERGF